MSSSVNDVQQSDNTIDPQSQCPSGGSKPERLKRHLLLRNVVLKSRYRRERERDLTLIHEQLSKELQPVGRLEKLVVEEMAANLFSLSRCERKERAEVQKQLQAVGAVLDEKIAEVGGIREKLEAAIAAGTKILEPFQAYGSNGWEGKSDDEVRKQCLEMVEQYKQRYSTCTKYAWEPDIRIELPTKPVTVRSVDWHPSYDLKREADEAAALPLPGLVSLVVRIWKAPVEAYRRHLDTYCGESESETAKVRASLESAKFLSRDTDEVIGKYQDGIFRRHEELNLELQFLQSVRQRKRLLRTPVADVEQLDAGP